MEITEVKIITMGVSIEVRITVNNAMRFYSNCNFDTVEQARAALANCGLKETVEV